MEFCGKSKERLELFLFVSFISFVVHVVGFMLILSVLLRGLRA
jgi:hypothetical protein